MMSLRSNKGVTMVELLIAAFVALIVVLAMGRIITTNIRSWNQGRDKAVLQQNVTEALEWMARSIRGARTIEVISSTQFSTYDETGSLVHTYALSGDRLHEDGSDLVDRKCTSFSVTPDADTTSLVLELELEDDAGMLVAARTRAAARNRTFEF
jgi:Tfp pilus assembly protein PilV